MHVEISDCGCHPCHVERQRNIADYSFAPPPKTNDRRFFALLRMTKVIMKSHPTLLCVLLVSTLPLFSSSFAQEQYRGGVVYGPKAAFKIDAPTGWVLDNESGKEQGLPCVLYPKGSSWADAKTIMYAKIASTEYEDVQKFVAVAIKEMEKMHGKPKEKIDKGKTGDGQLFFINEYPATKTYSQWERVAYIQLPKAVAYIVLSSRDEASYRKAAPALREALKTFGYLEPRPSDSKL